MSCGRQTQGKDRTLVDLACNRYRSAVSFHDFLYDGEPKSGTTRILRPGPIGPIKPLEEMRKMFRLDSMASVFDSQSDLFPNRLQADGHGSTRRRIAKGIVEEINQRLFEPLCVTENWWNRLAFSRQCDPALIEQNGQITHDIVNQWFQGEGHEVNGRLIAREFCECQ